MPRKYPPVYYNTLFIYVYILEVAYRLKGKEIQRIKRITRSMSFLLSFNWSLRYNMILRLPELHFAAVSPYPEKQESCYPVMWYQPQFIVCKQLCIKKRNLVTLRIRNDVNNVSLSCMLEWISHLFPPENLIKWYALNTFGRLAKKLKKNNKKKRYSWLIFWRKTVWQRRVFCMSCWTVNYGYSIARLHSLDVTYMNVMHDF